MTFALLWVSITSQINSKINNHGNILGLAHDLKTVSDELIRQRCLRTGDGGHRFSKMSDENNNAPLSNKDREVLLGALDPHKEENMVWGWDDKDMTDHDRELATIFKKSN